MVGKSVIYYAIKTPFIVSDRDLVVSRDIIQNYRGYNYLIFMNSIEHPSKPESASVGVRAKMYSSFAFLRTLANGKTELSLINCLDVNGYIPDMVKNKMIDGMASRIKGDLEAGFKDLRSKGLI